MYYYKNLIISLIIFIVISSYLIITFSNTAFSLVVLILNFIISFFILLLLNCEFLALLFLLVYIGAILILFLFLLMLLDIKFNNLNLFRNFLNNSFFQFLYLFFIFLYFIFTKIQQVYYIVEPFNFVYWKFIINSTYNINIYSVLLYNNFIIELLVIGFILLLTLIGIVFIINNYLNFNIKYSSSMQQISIKSKFFY